MIVARLSKRVLLAHMYILCDIREVGRKRERNSKRKRKEEKE
jgi:hypothetical protein